jgi:hypothetical protein
VDEEPFKLEKEIQDVVESNLNKLFLLDFVATEFPIENYRFDTVAFNNMKQPRLVNGDWINFDVPMESVLDNQGTTSSA